MDPNSRGKLCARGQAALNHQYHPERLLYPLKRVGPRGGGKWRRITWEEAYDEFRRDAAEEGPRVRQARGVRLPPGSQPQQGRDQPLPARVRHQHRAQPPRPVLGLTPRRGADVSVRVRLGPRRLRALEVHPELRLEHVRGAPGPRRRRAAHPARPLRQRRQAGDLRRADVEHRRQQRRVLHARARHRRRRRARHGAHHHQREALRRGVLPRLGQRAARRALGADQAVHARSGPRRP